MLFVAAASFLAAAVNAVAGGGTTAVAAGATTGCYCDALCALALGDRTGAVESLRRAAVGNPQIEHVGKAVEKLAELESNGR